MGTRTIALLLLGIGFTLFPIPKSICEELPLTEVRESTEEIYEDQRIWGNDNQAGDKQALLMAIDYSLQYLNTPTAAKDYENYPIQEITRDRVIRSLERFRELLVNSKTAAEFAAAVKREFVLYQSVGKDAQGTVLFTGYFEPVYQASPYPNQEYRYPLYRKPADFDLWETPHPTRIELEGKDGLLGQDSRLAGYELVWLRERWEAFLIHVQGSARLELTDGTTMTVGYGGGTDHPYTSIGGELIRDGKLTRNELSLPRIVTYFEANPQELDLYISRNQRFIFFRDTNDQPPIGKLNVPVIPFRSIATDKSIMPPGALALIHTTIPDLNSQGQWEHPLVSRYVLDQDTGSAIIGPGRVDIFMGSGPTAGDRAGIMNSTGELYYLLLKE